MNSPAINSTFEEKMFEKIKSQMGDLLTNEDLKKILESAVEKAFFKDRRIPSPNTYGSSQIKESLFIELISKELKPLIKAAVKTWVTENQELVEQTIDKVLTKNAAGLIANAFGEMMSSSFSNFRYNLLNEFNLESGQ